MTHAATRHQTKGPEPTPNKTVRQEKNPPIAAPAKQGLSDATTCNCLNASLKFSVRNSMPSWLALLSSNTMTPCTTSLNLGRRSLSWKTTLEFVPFRLMSCMRRTFSPLTMTAILANCKAPTSCSNSSRLADHCTYPLLISFCKTLSACSLCS